MNGTYDLRSKDKENKHKESAIEVLNQTFHKNAISMSSPNVVLDKNNRPKCDSCHKICEFDWWVRKETNRVVNLPDLVCNACFDQKFSENNSNDYDQANFYDIIKQNEGILILIH